MVETLNVDELIQGIYRKEQIRPLWGNSHLRGSKEAERAIKLNSERTVSEIRKGVSRNE